MAIVEFTIITAFCAAPVVNAHRGRRRATSRSVDRVDIRGRGRADQADVPTTVVLHRFFFPAWRLEPALSIAANEPFKLVSFTAPLGRHAWHLARTTLPEEKVGWATSGASLLLLLGWAAAARRRARPA